MDPVSLKRRMIGFEQQQRFCDLLDLDVVTLQGEELHQVSRTDFKIPPRACLVCGGRNQSLCALTSTRIA